MLNGGVVGGDGSGGCGGVNKEIEETKILVNIEASYLSIYEVVYKQQIIL